MGQRRGFLKVPDLDRAGSRYLTKLKSKKLKSKKLAKSGEVTKTIKLNVSAWEKENLDKSKGTSWVWKTSREIVNGVFSTVFLTAVRDSKIVWRIDNFLGASSTRNMAF